MDSLELSKVYPLNLNSLKRAHSESIHHDENVDNTRILKSDRI